MPFQALKTLILNHGPLLLFFKRLVRKCIKINFSQKNCSASRETKMNK